MTNDQAKQVLRKALAAIEDAGQASLPTQSYGNSEIKAFRIPTDTGSVIVKEDGTVIIDTTELARFSESIKRFEKSVGMMSGISGEVCTACNGTGRM